MASTQAVRRQTCPASKYPTRPTERTIAMRGKQGRIYGISLPLQTEKKKKGKKNQHMANTYRTVSFVSNLRTVGNSSRAPGELPMAVHHSDQRRRQKILRKASDAVRLTGSKNLAYMLRPEKIAPEIPFTKMNHQCTTSQSHQKGPPSWGSMVSSNRSLHNDLPSA